MRLWLALSCLMIAASVAAQGLYKYRDADGNWVYTDRQPDAVQDYEQVPLADSAHLGIKLLRRGVLKTYKGLPHGMFATHPEIINADLLAFMRT